jgi:hypothetical protein
MGWCQFNAEGEGIGRGGGAITVERRGAGGEPAAGGGGAAKIGRQRSGGWGRPVLGPSWAKSSFGLDCCS